jgi:hypothetical protein
MQERFFKIIRLRTGEFIAGKTDRDFASFSTESKIRLFDPMLVMISTAPTGLVYDFHLWMPLSDSEHYDLTSEMVLTMGNMRSDVQRRYTKHIELLIESKEAHEKNQAIAKLLLSVQPNKTEIRIVEVDELAMYKKDDTQVIMRNEMPNENL